MKAAGRWIRIGILSGLIILILALAVRYGKVFLQAMLPLGLGVIIAYIELPIVEAVDKQKVSRTISILTAFAISLFIITIVLLCIIPLLINNIKDLTSVIPEKFNTAFNKLLTFIERNIPSNWHQDVLKELDNSFIRLQDKLTEGAYSFISNIPKKVSYIFDFLIGWILSFYILRDKERIIGGIEHFFPIAYREDIICFFRDIHRVVLRFIQGQVLIAMIIAVIETVGLYIIGMKYAPLLGFIGGISNMIPYFGPYIGAVPALAVALTISPWKAVWTAVIFIIAQQFDNVILSPKIMKGKLGLHPVITVMAVIVGGKLFGLAGLLFSVPMVAILKVFFKRIIKTVSG